MWKLDHLYNLLCYFVLCNESNCALGTHCIPPLHIGCILYHYAPFNNFVFLIKKRVELFSELNLWLPSLSCGNCETQFILDHCAFMIGFDGVTPHKFEVVFVFVFVAFMFYKCYFHVLINFFASFLYLFIFVSWLDNFNVNNKKQYCYESLNLWY